MVPSWGQRKGNRTMHRLFMEAYQDDVLPLAHYLRSIGATHQDIADRLNKEKKLTRNGRRWSRTLVRQLFVKAEREL